MPENWTIRAFREEDASRWDRFVLKESINGTFLQTRNFLNYHPKERFKDHSLIILNGTNWVAVIPAHVKMEERKKLLLSHQGSTFGGLVVGKQSCKIPCMEAIMETLDAYLVAQGVDEIILKQTGSLFQQENAELIDYFLFLNGFTESKEVGFYIDFEHYHEETISNYSSSRRRDYRYSLKNGFSFQELNTQEQIGLFYKVLCDNYRKFGKAPVHTLKELLDFKTTRLTEETGFYGVFTPEEEMIAGAMVFSFGKKVLHTQYLAVMQEKKDLFANEFLYTNLIENARAKGYKILSFGTSTFEGGKVLNRPLALFKEGFGTQPFINRTYRKNYEMREKA